MRPGANAASCLRPRSRPAPVAASGLPLRAPDRRRPGRCPSRPLAALIPAPSPSASPASASAALSNGGLGGPASKLPAPPSGPITGAALGDLVHRFRRLQNGSDIRGIALEGVPNEPVTLSSGVVFFIGVAFAQWLRSKGHSAVPKVSVGRDPRLSGPLLESAFAAGLLHGGAALVHLFGLATTPAMFYSIVLSGGACKGPASPAFFSTAASVASAAKRAAPLLEEEAGGRAPPPPPSAAELEGQPYTGAAIIEHVRRRNEGSGGLSELLAGLAEPAESREWRIRIQHADFKAVGAQVLSAFRELVVGGSHPDWSLEPVNHEGWRVAVDEGGGRRGWLLLRQSLHDPLLVLNVESEVAGGAEASAARVAAFLRGGPLAQLPLDLGGLKAL
ncbi:hypothetical protein GPECTOR_92g601 [Gonium pectorale]|uniref:Alpha-D-phosphohexomutase alpha/beta/alpha domain-containing protein n=1 Tax=Gonium pectorale TaxID=33097 RepID=A0A150G0L6_GONPE|nr:hypothetical protein GPECTOR_92g601 [Gonium pectorale]|eukprot:KXZ43378.1 hypothetical protein GPECTOR_92g601 [Gonium pectorale]